MQIDNKTPLTFVDLETTGTSPHGSRVIEIGIVRVEGGIVVKEYRTFVNHGEPVPDFITSLTGISSSMIVSAPTFDEVVLTVEELLSGALFIAHNASFDYHFLFEEFRRVGIVFSHPYLCTAKLSRELYPKSDQHNLDSIIDRFNLDPGNRHRALDDARVLWQFLRVANKEFGVLRVREVMQEHVRVRKLPIRISEEMVDSLPEQQGVYFFHGENDELLYIGKSRKIRSRVRSHITKDGLSRRGQDMLSKIRRITYRETAGELGALLLESHLIRSNSPTYNSCEREQDIFYVAKESINKLGYKTLSLHSTNNVPVEDEKNVIALFKTKKQSKDTLSQLIEEHELCGHILGIESEAPCSLYKQKKCRGACAGKEKHRHYNRRFREAFLNHRFKKWPLVGPVGIEERGSGGVGELFIVDNWRLLSALHYNGVEWEEFIPANFHFNYDMYKIFSRELLKRRTKLVIRPLTTNELQFFIGGGRATII